MTQQLQGRVALITGAGGGIGEAIARRFAAEGSRVVIAEISDRRGKEVADAIGDAALALQCDVGDPEQVEAVVAAAVDAYGRLDILVNNAAVERRASLAAVEPEIWGRTLAVNVGGVLAGIRYAAPAIAASGGGSIVNVSSVASQRVLPGLGVYSASKAAVEALTRTAAVELRPAGIRVNALLPGFTRTPGAQLHASGLADGVHAALDEHVTARQGRWADPEEIASAALHLVSDEASFTSGLLYVIDNGNSVAHS